MLAVCVTGPCADAHRVLAPLVPRPLAVMLSLGPVFSEPPLCAGFTACAGTAALIPGTRAAGRASRLFRVPLLACLRGSRLEPPSLTELNFEAPALNLLNWPAVRTCRSGLKYRCHG